MVDALLPNKERACFDNSELRGTNKKMKVMGLSEKRRKTMMWNVSQLSFPHMVKLVIQTISSSGAQLLV